MLIMYICIYFFFVILYYLLARLDVTLTTRKTNFNSLNINILQNPCKNAK